MSLGTSKSDEFRKDEWKEKNHDSSAKSSTLSLHIAAYEDSIDADKFDGTSEDLPAKKIFGNGKSWKDGMQVNVGIATNPFEIPRQQSDNEQEPEILQFRAGQRLSNPNIDNQQNPNADRFDAVVSYACDLGMDGESLTLFLMVLAEEEESSGGRDKSAHWKMLANLVNRKTAFNDYAQTLVVKKRKKDSENIMRKAREMQLIIDRNGLYGNRIIDFCDNHRHMLTAFFAPGGLLWSRLPSTGKIAVLDCLSQVASGINNHVVSAITEGAKKLFPIIAKHAKSAGGILALIPLFYEILRSVWLWYHGEISGARAAQNFINAIVSTVSGVNGAATGAAIGSAFGPLGGLFGAVVGGVGWGIFGAALSDVLTREIFDLPKTEALEKAYRYLGVHHRASDAEVSEAYRKRLLIDHPDKGGSNEAFYKLQTYIAIIHVARLE
uniref:J domain-containing protein n=1 Tax=Panagrolaimus sp. ES5 TaxID=591445 RepID=A0AC34FCR7_9BILA